MKKNILFFIYFILTINISFSQAPGCPNIIASNDTTLDCIPCIDLSATVLHTGETTTYGVMSIPYAPPFPFSGGTQIPITSDDDWSNVINIPFNFCFYDNMYNQLIIGDNGVISFDLTDAGGYCPWSFSDPIPFDFGSIMNIFGAYHDTYLPAGGSMWYSLEGTYPCRMFVFKFNNVAQFDCNSIETTQQIILYETTNVIEVYIDYKPVCSTWNDGNALIGIQDMAQTTALAAPGRNTGVWTLNDEAWRFYPDGNPNYVINWYEGGNIIGQGNSINVCLTSTTTYTAEVVYTTCDGGIVSDTDNVVVTVISSLIADAGQDQTICSGDSITIGGNPTASNGTMPYSYSWSPTIGLSNPNVPNPIAFPINNTTYIVTITDAGGCISVNQINIAVTGPIVDASGSSPELCNSQDGSLFILASGGQGGPYDYSIPGETNQTGIFNNLTAGPYVVTITDVGGCSITEIITVGATGNVVSGFTSSIDQCFTGNSFDFINTGSTGDSLSWAWTFQNGNPLSSTDENPTGITWNTPGQYLITQTVIFGGCNDVFSYTIEVFDEPSVIISVTNIPCFGLCNGSLLATVSSGTLPYSYQWDDTNTQITETASNLCAGQYNVLITDINNCTVSASAIVTEPLEPLAIVLNKTDALCFGSSDGTTNLTVTGGTQSYSFNWDSGHSTEDINYIPVGTYCVTVTDAHLCTISDCITINEPTQLTYTTSTSPTTCFEGSDGMATVNVANGTPPYTYLWNNGDLGPSAVNISAGTYTVIVTDNNGCSFTTSMTITEPDRVMASTNADMWICIGETATLNAAATGGTPGYTFHWSGGLPDAQSVNVSPVITTQYCMYAEDSHGCISANYCVNVNVYLPITIVVTSDVDEICPGEPVTVSVVATGGNGNYIYTLDNDNTTINPPYTDYPFQSISYTVTVSDDCGSPTDFGTVSVTVLPMPPNSFAPDITEGCQPLTIQFIESSPDEGQTYNWNFDDENSYNTSGNKNPTHIFEESGVYDITLTVTDTNGCINVDVVEDLITVYPKPVAKFEPDPEIASVIKPVIYFNNLTIGAVDYHWFFGDGDSSLAENPYHIYAPTGQTYIVELKVESNKGCLDTVFLEVRIKDEYTFYAPTAFSPDGDLINDEFFIVGHGIDERNFKLLIYDRWGEIIFQSNNPFAKWDGKAKIGNKECQIGTYTWLCVFKDITGIERAETGPVTIIR